MSSTATPRVRRVPIVHIVLFVLTFITTSMAGALWQMAAPGTRLRALYESDPELAHAVVDVEPRLIDILSALLIGYAARST